MAVVLAQVSFEHLDDHVQVRLDGRDVPAQPGICGPKLFVGSLLRHGNLRNAVNDLTNNRREAHETRRHLLQPCVEPRLAGRRIRRKLRLLLQQELHRALHLFGGQRLKLHESTSARLRLRHYGIARLPDGAIGGPVATTPDPRQPAL